MKMKEMVQLLAGRGFNKYVKNGCISKPYIVMYKNNIWLELHSLFVDSNILSDVKVYDIEKNENAIEYEFINSVIRNYPQFGEYIGDLQEDAIIMKLEENLIKDYDTSSVTVNHQSKILNTLLTGAFGSFASDTVAAVSKVINCIDEKLLAYYPNLLINIKKSLHFEFDPEKIYKNNSGYYVYIEGYDMLERIGDIGDGLKEINPESHCDLTPISLTVRDVFDIYVEIAKAFCSTKYLKYSLSKALRNLNVIQPAFPETSLSINADVVKRITGAEKIFCKLDDAYTAKGRDYYCRIYLTDTLYVLLSLEAGITCCSGPRLSCEKFHTINNCHSTPFEPTNMEIGYYSLTDSAIGCIETVLRYPEYISETDRDTLQEWLEFYSDLKKAVEGLDYENGGYNIKLYPVPTVDDFVPSDSEARITPEMNYTDVFLVLSENEKGEGFVPGATVILCKIFNESELCGDAGPLGVYLFLDSLHIYGSNIWILVKDCLQGSLLKLVILSQMWRNGDISSDEITDAVKSCKELNVEFSKVDDYGMKRMPVDYSFITEQYERVEY